MVSILYLVIQLLMIIEPSLILLTFPFHNHLKLLFENNLMIFGI